MQVLDAIPGPLRARGANKCTPIKCECGEQFLFALSDGVIEDGDLDEETVDVKCPTCRKVEALKSVDLVAHNGQAK